MILKKYISVIIIMFFIMNIVLANDNQTNVEEEKLQTIGPVKTIINKDTNKSESFKDIKEMQKNNIENNDSQTIVNNQNNLSKKIIENNNKSVTVNNNTEIRNISNKTNNNKEIKINQTNNSSIIQENSSIENANTTTETNKNYTKNQDYSYVDILKTSSKNNEKNQIKNLSNKTTNEDYENKKITINITLFKDGKKEIEGEIPINFTDEIKKQEKILNSEEFSKQVIIKSDEHLVSPLTIYSDIPIDAKKEEIKLYWQSQEKEVQIKDFFDEDKDGFIERISWIVPHLSEQIFEINITTNDIGDENSTDEITLSGNVNSEKNPVKFNFNINYTNISNLNCSLNISSLTVSNITFFNPSTQNSFQLNLPNDTYTWEALCYDKLNNSNNNSIQGTFNINQTNFEITNLKEAYLKNSDITFTLPQGYTSTNITIIYPNQSKSQVLEFQNTNTINIAKEKLTESGIYTLEIISTGNEKPIKIINKTFSILNLEITLDEDNIEKNDNAEITININSPLIKINLYELKFGDGTTGYIKYNQDANQISNTISHTYSNTGTFTLNLTVILENLDEFTITKNGITVESSQDTTPPEITLIQPENKQQINDNAITFKYNVTDNEEVDNCTYQLFYNSELNYSENTLISAQEKQVSIQLTKFSEGSYTWWVTCYDNSSNERDASRKFNVGQSTDYENLNYNEKPEISNAQEQLDNFLIKLDSKDTDVKNTLTEMGIYSDLEYYQKRIQAIKVYFQEGYKTVSLENREKRNQENLDELKEIKENTPLDAEITNSEEYIKNSVSENIRSIIKEIINSSYSGTDKKIIDKLTEINFQAQEKFTSTTKIKKIRLEYENKNKELTFISRNIKTTNENNKFVEYIPYEYEKATFITPAKKIKDSLYEIDSEDIEDNTIIYYIDNFIDTDEIKKSDTIIFQDLSGTDANSITGYSIIELDIKHSIGYSLAIIIFFILLYLIVYLKDKIMIRKLKSNENFSRSIEYLKKSKQAVIENRVESAKHFYHKIKDIYPLLPKRGRKKIHKDLGKIKIGIDKREIIGLVKEYEKLKQSGLNQEAKIIYIKIQKTYKQLPKRYKEKIYKKMFANPIDNFL